MLTIPNDLSINYDYKKTVKLQIINIQPYIASTMESTHHFNRPKTAIPFIIKKQATQCYELTKQAQQLLKNIDKPITVLSVAGLYRTGKSYLLNRVILDQKNIFGVGPTVNPCTKGLWMWIEPDPTTVNRDMLVIDTEGLGALDEQSNHDMKIFCLAVLLSTTFIYNSVGSIDENALQTLSLVLNLVSNIDQDNTQTRPQFIWVVRDFSLQLVNGDGVNLSPKEYLEMALKSNIKEQQKSMIRQTITNAFSERDCYTLVKPLIDEVKLQNLDDIPIDELRPEFVSQSIELRNKIKSSLRSYKLTANGEVKGKEYVTVVKKYLDAINKGAVPNIVDTWTFIMEQKCRQVLDETKKNYTQKINNRIMGRVPIKKQQIQQIWFAMKQQVRSSFIKTVFGGSGAAEFQQYQRCCCYEGLEDFLKNAEAHILRVNQQQGQKYVKNILMKEYQAYCKKLFSHYYNGYEEFEKDLKTNLRNSVTQKYSDKIDNVKDMVDRFIDGKLIENFKFFQKLLKDEVSKLASIKEELEGTLGSQISQMNQTAEREKRKLQEKIFDLEKQVNILENEKYQIDQASKSERNITQNKMMILKSKYEQSTQTIEHLNQELSKLNAYQSEIKEKIFLDNKEFLKDKALFQQKQSHLQKRIQQIQSRNADLQARINETGGKYESEKKGIVREYQVRIATLESENRQLLDHNTEAESKISKLTNELNNLSDEIQAIKKNSLSEKKLWEERITQAESNKKATPLQRELKAENQQLQQQLKKAEDKVNEYSTKIKSTQEQYKQLQNNSQKEIAIHCQKIQFQQIELKDFESRYNQLKVSYQKALESLQDNSKSIEHSTELRILQVKSQHSKQIGLLEQQFEEKEKILRRQLQISQRTAEELELQVSLEKKNLQNKEKQWKQTNAMLQSMCKKLQDKIKSSEKDYEDIFKEKQSFYQHRIKRLQEEVDEVKDKAQLEIQDNKKKSEEALSVLKHYSEIQKQQWEKRIHDDREKAQKKIAYIRDDYEKRIQEDKATFQEQISELQEKLAHMDRVFNERLQNMQYDHDIHVQKLTNNFNEMKVEREKRIALLEQQLEIKNSSFQKELANKTKQFQHTLYTTKEDLQREHQQRVSEIKEAYENIRQKYEAVKKENRQLEQNNLIIKNQSDKERAVIKQKQKSFEAKIRELENRLEEELTTYNSVIEKINEKNNMERNNLNNEIERLNREVLELQREANERQKEFQNQKSKHEMKIKYLTEQKLKSKEEYEDFMHKFQVTVRNLNRQKEEIISSKRQELSKATENFQKQMKVREQNEKKVQKNHQDRIARLAVENKSLRERIMSLQLGKLPSPTNKYNAPVNEELTKDYEKRIEEYKELLEREKTTTKKLHQENKKLKVALDQSEQSQSSIYYERPSFSEISNSRISQPYQMMAPTYQQQTEYRGRENRMDKSSKKYSNTPLINKKSRVVDVEQFNDSSMHNRRRY